MNNHRYICHIYLQNTKIPHSHFWRMVRHKHPLFGASIGVQHKSSRVAEVENNERSDRSPDDPMLHRIHSIDVAGSLPLYTADKVLLTRCGYYL